MYPDWPKSPADLVPLPLCDGPKLKAFDFQGPQKIKFLEHIGTGAHSQVFKVEILDKVYALKGFRFLEVDHVRKLSPDGDWYREIDWPAVIYESDYSELFNCECRAYGRLQETDNGDLANRCFGYVLLDEVHEFTMMDKCRDLKLNFGDSTNLRNATNFIFPRKERGIFLGKSGREPPFRCVVKEFDPKSEHDDLRIKDFRSILRDMIKIQQLGIINLDVGIRQIINGILSDFSTAYTQLHYLLNPELNPRITPDLIPTIEYDIFGHSLCDFVIFDAMVEKWNRYASENQKHKVSICALPGGSRIRKQHPRYNLRSTISRASIFTLVDTRQYDWVTPTTGEQPVAATRTPGARRSGRGVERRGRGVGAISKKCRILKVNPPRWYYDGHISESEELRRATLEGEFMSELDWAFKDNLMFPKRVDLATDDDRDE
ncbi:uncharacterized protein DNG_09923 [Cephalotrichum gorgonifer]|uniref:Uncharacterized protein n=1 Tax=Cephalotrichum gorgonifer TaxID=2041049 RepID=A0AAE8SZR5_9PEZI|nr:uncharacterized protein DNG_09923 [Cephalotrichum gorgonifer]